jgi:3-oxoacyl-(acyl-carrier-protein) synthase
MTASNPIGVQICIRKALTEAGIKSDEIQYVNGHLTGTKGDSKEINNLIQGLNIASHRFPRINATKSLIGHALGASGAIESVATILQMYEGFLHKSTNCEDLHPDIEQITESIVRQTCTVQTDVALKTSFGFGDVNACVVFRKVLAVVQ